MGEASLYVADSGHPEHQALQRAALWLVISNMLAGVTQTSTSAPARVRAQKALNTLTVVEKLFGNTEAKAHYLQLVLDYVKETPALASAYKKSMAGTPERI